MRKAKHQRGMNVGDVAGALSAAGIDPSKCGDCPLLQARLGRASVLHELARRLSPTEQSTAEAYQPGFGGVLAEAFENAANETEEGIGSWARGCYGTFTLPVGIAGEEIPECDSRRPWHKWTEEERGQVSLQIDNDMLARLLEATEK